MGRSLCDIVDGAMKDKAEMILFESIEVSITEDVLCCKNFNSGYIFIAQSTRATHQTTYNASYAIVFTARNTFFSMDTFSMAFSQ